MNNALSPIKIMLLCIVQVILAYSVFMNIAAEKYAVILNYKPLILWSLAAYCFLFGVLFVKLIFYSLGIKIQDERCAFKSKLKIIKIDRLNSLYYFAFLGLIVTSLFIIIGTGGIPLLAIISQSKGISELNDLQSESLPGLYGMHAFMIVIMEYCVGLFVYVSLFLNKKISRKTIFGSLSIIIATLLEGKRQGLAIFICILGVAFMGAKNLIPINLIVKYNNIFRRYKVIALMSLVVFFCITYIRLSAVGYGDDTLLEPLRYLSLPLINLEYLSDKVEWFGLEFDAIKPLNYLLPAKFGIERGVASIMVPEPTSPSGYFAMAYLYWCGIYGLAFYSFCVGAFSEYFFIKAVSSPVGMLFYGYIVWAILMSHTYNHFLTITFIPMQLLVYYLINMCLIFRTKFSNVFI
jgi:oligosaccharide repeat unit polymerase